MGGDDVLRANLGISLRYVASDPAGLTSSAKAIGWSEESSSTPEPMGGWAVCGGPHLMVVPGRHTFIGDPADRIGPLSRRGQR